MRDQKIRKLFKIAVSFFKYQLNPRPKVWWWRLNERDEIGNFGDMLTPYIVYKLTGRKPLYYSPNEISSKYVKHSIMTGSIIRECDTNTIVWGSGLISRTDMVKNARFYAVRGEITRKKMLADYGIQIPAIGDPALLLPLLYKCSSRKPLFEYGIIPHYVDYENVYNLYSEFKDSIVINLQCSDIESVIDEIVSCKYVISSSLHGIITAHAYGIPAIWIDSVNELAGDNVKFYDYFESVGLDNMSKSNLQELLHCKFNHDLFCIPTASVLIKLQNDLLRTFPYKIKSEYVSY